MKQLLFAILFFAVTCPGYSQLNEFPVYSNGFIYTDMAMQQLKHVVDSLNLKYKRCDLNRKYYSVKQGLAYYITLKKSDARAATTAILDNISFADFIKKYPASVVDSNLLLTAWQEQNYKNGWLDVYEVLLPETDQILRRTAPGKGSARVERWHDWIWGRKGNWVFDYTPLLYDSMEYLKAIYIVQEPVATVIPDDYAKLILYADCMIDTTSGVFFITAKSNFLDFEYPEKKPPAVISKFLDYVDRKAKSALLKYRPDSIQRDNETFTDSLKQAFIEDSLSKNPVFRRLLSQAVEQTLRLKLATNDWFEYYVELYYSKSAALAMKRNRIVSGACSRDPAPRLYAISIALLAAETANWQVFLRAHLDIMNDQFDRTANSNIAQVNRKTYIKEIEALDINIQDLMLGISFGISNPASNHYFGDIDRLGRAFAETKDSSAIETKLLSAIRDNRLDYCNRLRLRNLFLTYAYYLPGKEHRMACIQQLEEADKSLPAFLLPKAGINHEVFGERPMN